MQTMEPKASQGSTVQPSDGFRPVQGQAPQHDGAKLMAQAYVALWVILLVFVWMGHRKQRHLGARIERLEKALMGDNRAKGGHG